MSERTPEGMIICDNCGGEFFPEDMDGDHCLDCAEELFGDEEQRP